MATESSITPSSSSKSEPKRFEHIKGWGVDLNRADRPAYPKERKPPRLDPRPSEEAVPQQSNVEVFHSTERPGMTSVFGTTQPPSGLSGRIRARAFKHSENDLRHWLLLLFADRVNMFEGIFSDMIHGRLPNVYKEMGGPAAMRYDRKRTVRKLAVGAVVVGAVITVFAMRRRRRLF